jgi:DNA-binding transcriptional MerR regulator
VLIGEVAALTGASRRSLRYYEDEGLLISVRAANGYRTYDAAAVATVQKIKALLGAGMTLDLVRQVLPCTVDATPRVEPCARLLAALRGELARLDESAAAIQLSRSQIAAIVERSTTSVLSR